MRRLVLWILAIVIALVLFALFIKLPLAKISTTSGNVLYINGVRQQETTSSVAMGKITIASASPLHEKTTKTITVWPFQSQEITPSSSTLTTDDIIRLTKVQTDDYVMGSVKYYENNRWLVVNFGSPVPDGGAFSAIMAWRPLDGSWKLVGYFDGSNATDFNHILPDAVAKDLGL